MRLVVQLFLSVDGEEMEMDMLQEDETAIDEETINEEGEEDPRGSGDYKVHMILLEPLQQLSVYYCFRCIYQGNHWMMISRSLFMTNRLTICTMQ